VDIETQAIEELKAQSALAWVLHNEFKNENDKPIEFSRHRFLVEPYNDDSPDLVVMKSAQIGWSTLAILKSFHALKYRGKNIIYTLPTQNVVKDFVVPKVDRLIEVNPGLKELVTKDSLTQKRVGDRFVYFKGSFVEREAIMIAADMLVNDELDRSDQSVLTIYSSRLQAAEEPVQWRFSNPSVPAFGVHELYQNSDQMHWFVTCSHCRHEAFMDYERDDYVKTHYVDQVAVRFACGKCHGDIRMEDRQSGRWAAKYPEVERRGYWISQLMAPWVTAKKIIEQSKEGIDFFYNFVLGLPYQASELLVNRQALLRCLAYDELVDKTDVFMGVDSGKEKHWVMGNATGVFAYGKTTEWSEIEALFNSFNATTVIDALPDFTIPEQFAKKYRGKVFVHYYSHDQKTLKVSVRDESKNYGVIKSDRTKLLDQVAGEIATQTMRFYLTPDKMDDLIYHCENSYRMVEEDTRGIQKARWEHKENKPDHWFHALAYYRVALSNSPLAGTTGSTMPNRPMKQQGIHVEPTGVPVSQVVDLEKSRDIASRRKHKRGI
jgi:hypothetical protein